MSQKCIFQLIVFLAFCIPVASNAQTGEAHVSSSNSGGSEFEGIDINRIVGAHRFYDEGYTGTRALLGNIEGGQSGIAHQSMSNVTQQIQGTGAPGTVHNHAGAVTHAMSGSLGAPLTDTNYWAYGVAYESETWSGDIATGFNTNGSYQLSWASIASTYNTLLNSGLNGQTVDVFNSSWGFSNPTGIRRDAIGVDGLINRTGVVGVVSAGNDGPGTDTVGGYGAAYNSITVGATGPDTGSAPYGSVTSFSSRSPNSFAMATSASTWDTIDAGTAQRAAVDIVAPGQNMTLANPVTSDTWYGFNWQGTSFSAPTVAGGTGLMVDVAKDLFATAESIDGRTIKAILLNSAQKLIGWDNGQADIGGVITTTQSLDFEQGTGTMNLNQTFDQLVAAGDGGKATTTDVAGTNRGDQGDVGAIGWDFGVVDATDSNLYYISQLLLEGTEFNATATWFADRNFGSADDFAGAEEEHLANLDLRVFEFDNLTDRNIIRIAAESISEFNLTEHLSFQLDATGFYGIEVNYDSAVWNFSGETNETYGLSWFGTAVPEPGSMVFCSLLGLCLVARRKR